MMQQIWSAALAGMLCVSVLCACGGEKQPESTAQGNEASFNITQNHLSDVVKGAWVNQNDLNDKIKIGDDLSLTHFDKADKHTGKAALDEKSGMLTITYDDSFRDEKTYIWVDSKKELNANTWYVDGGTFAFGGTVYIKDMEI